MLPEPRRAGSIPPLSPMSRVFKLQKQRIREGYLKSRLEMMELDSPEPDERASARPKHEDRATLCLPNFEEEQTVHGGDDGYQDVLRKYFPAAESNATERLINLKAKLRLATTYDFWRILMEEMCDIFSAECGYVSKRILLDDETTAVEMPELGEPGSCLMGTAYYLNHGDVVKKLYRDYRYTAYGTPCAHMKHDKVFVIPERMHEVIPHNPNPMPWGKCEAFIGVPLFLDGKCFAHFGMIWGREGASKIRVGWNYIEMFLHSIEDMILQRLAEGRGFAKEPLDSESAKIIPLSAITASQSLKPYARSLSHELRTPMQGVVGMLDIMYATVIDAIASQPSDTVRAVFQELKSHIEVVQDSSKRAVEAADNVVHAYDLNMQMPEAPMTPDELDPLTVPSLLQSPAPDERMEQQIIAGTRSPSKRSRSMDIAFHEGPPLKKMFAVKEADEFRIYCSEVPLHAVAPDSGLGGELAEPREASRQPSPVPGSTILNPLHRRVVTRDFLTTLLSDTLRSSHPIKKVHTPTELGETIEVQTIGSRGELQDRIVHLVVDADVPEVIITEQQHLQFSLQKVIDNAIKFTESGSISVRVKVGANDEKIEVSVVDTGCGIDEESQQNLFKPHFQQDSSISRARDGLGLSLFNAKAHIRRSLGGDVTLQRSATQGPRKGSEFLIRLPMSTLDLSDDAPIVGTPPSSHSSIRPLWAEPNASPSPMTKSPSMGSLFPPNFSVLPPATHAPQERRKTHPTTSTSTHRRTFNPKLAQDYPLNILLAEDNAINRDVAVNALRKLGYSKDNITVAFDGAQAVERYRESLEKPPSERFNAILMDIWMPNMDGYEATQNIKHIAGSIGERITTIAVTADITSESVERAKAVGMEGFLAKPYKVIDFERLIKEHFVARQDE